LYDHIQIPAGGEVWWVAVWYPV